MALNNIICGEYYISRLDTQKDESFFLMGTFFWKLVLLLGSIYLQLKFLNKKLLIISIIWIPLNFTLINNFLSFLELYFTKLLPHLVPYNTGHAPWRVNRSGSPESSKLYQKIADPGIGLTPTPILGNTVLPPAGTLFI